MDLNTIYKKVEDIFTFVNNIKLKMDSLRDRMIEVETRMNWINKTNSDFKRELDDIKFISENVGTHLGVEVKKEEELIDDDDLKELGL